MRSLLTAAVSVASFLLIGMAARADEVVIKTANGQELKQTGTIASDDSDGITLKIGGGAGEQVFRLNEVIRAKVKYECLQRHYEVGRGFEEAGQYDLAIDKFEDATKDTTVPKHAKQYAWLHIAACYEKLREYDKAANAYKKVLEEMPKTAFKREVADGQFNSYIKLGKWDEAGKALAVLEEQGDDGKQLAGVYLAELLERKAEAKEGEFAKAAEAYKTIAKPQMPPELLCKAYVGAARCLLQDNRAAEAAELAKKTLAVKGCTDLAAADAHQIIGESLLTGLSSKPAELAQEKNRERALDAIEKMMRAVLQYKGSPWAEQRAYFTVGQWAAHLSTAGVTPVEEWARRASWANGELKAKYPKSPLLQKAGKQG